MEYVRLTNKVNKGQIVKLDKQNHYILKNGEWVKSGIMSNFF